MTDTPSVPRKTHFLDWTLGRSHRAACGSNDNALPGSQFEKTDPADRCEACEKELADSMAYQLKCRICGTIFESQSKATEHEQREHVLTVASHRKEPLCFVLNVQMHYDSVGANARAMSRARQELKKLPDCAEYDFDFVPGRLMLTSRGANNVLLGEAFVAEFLIVPR